MRYGLIVFLMLLGSATSTLAQVSIGIGLPSVSIGINLPVYPELVQVPDYPVYYAPRLNSNFFFYDGMYWVYQGDDWYASSWYNGPWELVAPQVVPVFVLRIPVRYYRVPPVYFRGWQADAPPRWGEHWGPSWERGRSGWDRWNRRSAPAPAPLPDYQRHYPGDRYPRIEQQRELHGENYRYQPRDAVVRQRFQEQQAAPRAPAPSQRERQPAPQERDSRPQDVQRRNPPPPQPRRDEEAQRPVPHQAPPRQREPAVQEQRPQQPPHEAAPQERQRPRQGQGQGQGQGRERVIEDEERGPGRGRQ
ncbi:hypothetical protein [Rhodoferax ferrireducens]|uniref:hypothetical protein n=1 Tax=Rhodoferax ferrireducens TaxID=192843 RepID=UPI000E0D3FB5|nr:hypothetical protein [Rhodoferax ferrireducens]